MIDTTEETSREEKKRMADIIYKKRPESIEEIDEHLRRMASVSRLKVGDQDTVREREPEPLPALPPPFDGSEESLSKWVGKKYQRRNPGICAGVTYTVLGLRWSESEQWFRVQQDSPELESEMNCRNFCVWMVEVKPKSAAAPAAAEPPRKTKTAWSGDKK